MSPRQLLASTRLAMIAEARAAVLRAVRGADQLIDPAALTAAYDQWLEGTIATTVRDGVATIPIAGPLFKTWNFLSWLFGASTYDQIAHDLEAALNDGNVRAIVLDINSPGGETAGLDELAETIYGARSTKPIVAFVSGMAASAAYWVASAARDVVLTPTSMVCGVGTVWTFEDDREYQAVVGIREVEIVSSQSPKKRLHPADPEGRADYQRIVDEIAAVFVSAVARNRGVSETQVLEDFGQGSVLVGEAAIAAGAADRVSMSDSLRAELARTDPGAELPALPTPARNASMKIPKAGSSAADGAPETPPVDPDEEKKKQDDAETAPTADDHGEAGEEETPAGSLTVATVVERAPDVAAQLRAEGAKAERDRLAGIDALARPGHAQLLAECKADPSCTPEAAAHRILLAEKAHGPEFLAKLRGDEARLDAPKNSPADDAGDDVQAIVGSIVSTYEHHSTRRATAGRA